MSGRQAKKLRKALRTQLHDQGFDRDYFDARLEERVEASFEEVIVKVAAELIKQHEQRIRPRPWWLPLWAWRRVVGRVLLPPPPTPRTPAEAGFGRMPN